MTGFYIIILLLLKFQQRIFSLRYKILRKIKLTCTSCFVLCNSWCQSVFTVSKFLCIPIFFPMFIRLLLNRDRSSLYLHKASWIWNWGELLFCCKSWKNVVFWMLLWPPIVILQKLPHLKIFWSILSGVKSILIGKWYS